MIFTTVMGSALVTNVNKRYNCTIEPPMRTIVIPDFDMSAVC